MGIRKAMQQGWQTASRVMEGTGDYGHSVLPATTKGRKFYADLKDAGVTTETPAQLAGAIGARVLTDLGTDGTRNLYWRFNHPSQVTQGIYEKAVGENIRNYTQPQKAAIALGAIGLPVGASLGTFDLTNLGELGRPKGFAQTYSEVGAEDRRETGQVVPELIDRFALGRQGRPLKFETAKEDIPDLTKERYTNYQKFLYNEKGPLGIGVIKGTMENLQGEPEVRLAGFPVGLQAVGAALGGTAGVRAATAGNVQVDKIGGQEVRRMGQKMPARKVAALGAAGALAGGMAGKLINMAIAQGARKDLPSTYEYSNQHVEALNNMLAEGQINERQYQAML